jgi:hypothetical protein
MKRLAACAALIACAACAGMKPPPEPVVSTKEVTVTVQVKCQDKREPVPDYPDTDAAIAAIPDDDIFGLSVIYAAGRKLRIARLAADDLQIKACTGE